jgi:hypothetical protein
VVARGRQRIRQRGSRQQWAQARDLKAFPGDDTADGSATPGSTPAALGEPLAPAVAARHSAGQQVVASTRCGLCNVVVEQRLREGRRVTRVPYALCISCDEVRCDQCWDADDVCAGDEEHEFLEVHYDEGGRSQVADFRSWIG